MSTESKRYFSFLVETQQQGDIWEWTEFSGETNFALLKYSGDN